MDLTKSFPRSPRDKLGGIVWLPRLIDKARADLAGTLGEYKFNCPLDQGFFKFFGIEAGAFKEAVKAAPDDNAVLKWVISNTSRTPPEIDEFNTTLAKQGPGGNSPTWFARIDQEEGRLK